jgi:AraC-like DNA-binding protein
MPNAPTPAGSGAADDSFARWLLDSIEFDSVVLHAGRYCGPWRASTSGAAKASFHLILRGECYLHIPGQPPLPLRARDGVFLLRDVDHHLSPFKDPQARAVAQSMLPLQPDDADGTGMACGFFHFHGALSGLVIDSFPDYLVARADDPALAGSATLFELMLAETGGDPEQPSPLLARLAELLFLYLLRATARRERLDTGLLALARHAEFAPLLDALLRAPAEAWSVESMARASHMSRATFHKRFADACGMPPAQLLLTLRMTIAAQRLKAGESVERAAGHVGYRSVASFTRAFERNAGMAPGAYRKQNGRQARLQTNGQEKPTPGDGGAAALAQ